MQENEFQQRYAGVLRVLCVLIVVLMLAASLYAGWIVLINFNTIGV